MKIDILAFGAHPDDVELSYAGTIMKNIALGKRVGIIDLTRGELGTRGTPAIRAKEANKAARVMGVSFRENLNMADGFFLNDKKHVLKVIQKIRQYKPDVVLANAHQDRHPDHGRGAQLVADACFLSGLLKIKSKLNNKQQDPWRPKAVYHYIQYRKLKPDFVVDISNFMDRKMECMSSFSSQFYNPNSKEPQTLISQQNFFDYILSREKEYGDSIGVRFAEGFNSVLEQQSTVLI